MLPVPIRDAAFLGSVSIEIPGDEWSSYTALVREVGDTTNDSLRAGLETPGWLAPATYLGDIYIPNHTEATLTKYTTDENGALVREATLSFANFGISWVAPVFIAPDKAYLFDDTNLQLLVWNPITMDLTGDVVDLAPLVSPPAADHPGHLPAMLADYGRVRGDRLFVPVRWTNWDADAAFLPSAGLLVIDTTNDTPLRLLQDERLADTIYTVMTDTQDIYLFTGALGVSHQYVRGNARPGGALRVRNGEEDFDPDFYINLDQAVGDRPASTPVWSSGTSVYLKAFHEEQQPLDPELMADPGDLLARAAWRYWEVDLEGNVPSRELPEIPWTSTDGFFYDLRASNGPLFVGVMSEDFGTTTLYEATPAGFERSIDVVGVLQVLTPLDAVERREGKSKRSWPCRASASERKMPDARHLAFPGMAPGAVPAGWRYPGAPERWRLRPDFRVQVAALDQAKAQPYWQLLSVRTDAQPLGEQKTYAGPVWLDRVRPDALGSTGFGREVQEALRSRHAYLRGRGLEPGDEKLRWKLLDLQREGLERELAARGGPGPASTSPGSRVSIAVGPSDGFEGRAHVYAAPNGQQFLAVRAPGRFSVVPVFRDERQREGQSVRLHMKNGRVQSIETLGPERERGPDRGGPER